MPSGRGSATLACGRAIAIVSTTNPATSRTPGRTARTRPRGRRPAVRRRAAGAHRARPKQGRRALPAARLDRARHEHADRHQHEQQEQLGQREGHPRPRRRRLRRAAIRTIAADEVLVGRQGHGVDPRPPEGALELGLARGRGVGEPGTELGVVGVDDQLLAGLGVLDHDRADVRQRRLARIDQPHGQHLVPPVEEMQRLLPAGRADEVGHDHDHRPPPDLAMRGLEQGGEVGDGSPVEMRLGHQVADEAQHLHPAARRGDRPVHRAREAHRADAVAAPGEEPRQHRGEVDQLRSLDPPVRRRPEVDRRAEVEQEPGRDLAVLVVLADVRHGGAGRDVPVDAPDVVAGLVLAQRREVQPGAPEQAAVVALEHPVEAADDLPVQALEDALRRADRPGTRRDAGRGGRPCARAGVRRHALRRRRGQEHGPGAGRPASGRGRGSWTGWRRGRRRPTAPRTTARGGGA